MLQLKHQMVPCFSGSMINKLFHHDFKFHLEAIAHLSEVFLFWWILFQFVVDIERVIICHCHSVFASCLLYQMRCCINYYEKRLYDFRNCASFYQQAVSSNRPAIIESLDIILRWFTLRFFDTKTIVLIKSLECLDSILDMLHEENYRLLEYEGSAFVPYLILKVSPLYVLM